MNKFYLGIDISKEQFDVCLTDGQESWSGQFDNQSKGFGQLSKWLKKRKVKQMHACLEATGRYGEAVAMYMHERGYPVSLINPARIKAYGDSQLKRNKTDQEDAKVIAHFCATQKPGLWTPPAPEILAAMAAIWGQAFSGISPRIFSADRLAEVTLKSVSKVIRPEGIF